MDLIKPKWKDVKTILLWKINIKEHTFSLSRKKESNNSMQQPFQIITKKKYTSLRFFFQYWMVLNWGRLLVMVGSPVYPQAKHSVLLSSYLTVLVQSNPSFHPYKIIIHQKISYKMACHAARAVRRKKSVSTFLIFCCFLRIFLMYLKTEGQLKDIHTRTDYYSSLSF